jgi:curved DNA-binding protein CbpA
MLPDYFKILEIPEDASEMEIKRAYRQKAKELHPTRINHRMHWTILYSSMKPMKY